MGARDRFLREFFLDSCCARLRVTRGADEQLEVWVQLITWRLWMIRSVSVRIWGRYCWLVAGPVWARVLVNARAVSATKREPIFVGDGPGCASHALVRVGARGALVEGRGLRPIEAVEISTRSDAGRRASAATSGQGA